MLSQPRSTFAWTFRINLLGAAIACLVGHAEATEPSAGMPKCEEFYDKWDVSGAPAGMMAMMGFSREVMAAKDCLKQNNVPVACEHWRKLLEESDKLGPPLSDNRSDVEAMMTQYKCE